MFRVRSLESIQFDYESERTLCWLRKERQQATQMTIMADPPILAIPQV